MLSHQVGRSHSGISPAVASTRHAGEAPAGRTGLLAILARAALTIALAAAGLVASAGAQEVRGTVKSIDTAKNLVHVSPDGKEGTLPVHILGDTSVVSGDGKDVGIAGLKEKDRITASTAFEAQKIAIDAPPEHRGVLGEFWHNFTHNLFKPLLLFFYLGFLIPLFKVEFEFPKAVYQGLTIYLLLSIGWHGGEELANLTPEILTHALGFMFVGFCTNFVIGILAYYALKAFTRLRKVDQATVAGFYGSDSAGTFATCVGVLTAVNIKFEAYMPVMLAVMEIPGCLVALFLVSRLRDQGMDPQGNMPDEAGYDPNAERIASVDEDEHTGPYDMTLPMGKHANGGGGFNVMGLTPKLLHEVFLNQGLFLLFGGILIGFAGGLQGTRVTRDDDQFFINLFQGMLCIFLLEMGITASRKLKDLKTAGWGYIAFGILAPNVFAAFGIAVAHIYSIATHTHFEIGSYVLFAVLCGAASYIAVPAVQRLAIPEASPTLPLAASLGLTFSYNVTIGIPVYIEIAKAVAAAFPVS